MRALIAGGTGLIGRTLAEHLTRDGHEVIILSRKPALDRDLPGNVRMVRWDGRTIEGWGHLADGADAVISLVGENLAAGRWTAARKRQIIASREEPGKAIVEAVAAAVRKPGVVVQASAVGYYGPLVDEIVTEEARPGTDFLAKVCQRWEESTQPVEAQGVRRVVIRSGVILSKDSVAFRRMVLPFKLFVGGPLGSGKQGFSWIHLEDEINAIRFLIENPSAQGVFNLVAPQQLTNRQFAKAIGEVMQRPSFFPVPAFVIRLVFGEMGTVVVDGQRVASDRLRSLGFTFRFPDARSALSDLLKR